MPVAQSSGAGIRRAVTASACGTAVAVLLTGCCSSSQQVAASSSPSTASTSPSTDPTAAAEQQALAAYRGMWAAETKIYTSGSLLNTDLQNYAADKALAGIRASEVYYQNQNLVLKGEPKLSPKVTDIDLAGKPQTAHITSCVDSSNFLPVDKTTGKSAKLASGVFRHVETATVINDNGKWLITQAVIEQDRTC